jgi:hypothetical protein
MGNPSLAGLKASAGMMVNYLYRLDALEENAQVFRRPAGGLNDGTSARPAPSLALGDSVREILKAVE